MDEELAPEIHFETVTVEHRMEAPEPIREELLDEVAAVPTFADDSSAPMDVDHQESALKLQALEYEEAPSSKKKDKKKRKKMQQQAEEEERRMRLESVAPPKPASGFLAPPPPAAPPAEKVEISERIEEDDEEESVSLGDVDEPEKEGKKPAAVTFSKVRASVWKHVVDTLKNLCLYDPEGKLIMFAAATVFTIFSFSANWAILFYSGATYYEIPFIDFWARRTELYIECTIDNFKSPTAFGMIDFVGLALTILAGLIEFSQFIINLIRGVYSIEVQNATIVPIPEKQCQRE
eukprot:snap_masked-scaffold_6-processed-gene-4.22-mRNA-1 protein AED:1.00 eAED:1.00 QI:0/0/0/0/1/1/2/0/291